MDWSIIGMGSPLVRTPPQSVPVRERGQEINQPTIQTTQPGSEPAQIGRSYFFYSYISTTAT